MTAVSLQNYSGVQFTGIMTGIGRLLRRSVAAALAVKPHVVRSAPLAATQTGYASSVPAVAAGALRGEPRRLDAAAQWAKVSTVLSTSIAGARAVADLQATATQKLDLAQYGLSTLMDELASVMVVPGRRQRAQVVHHVMYRAPQSPVAPNQAMAA